MPFASVIATDASYTWPQWYYMLTIELGITNSAINSIVYAATNPTFREGYMIFIKKTFNHMFRRNMATDSDFPTISK